MPAGTGLFRTDIDRWLYNALTADSLINQYAPGGMCPEAPPEGATGPFVRWWQQSPGRDTLSQDGRMSRAISGPKFVVCMLDRQKSGDLDYVDGTLGSGKFELGAKRLYTLLHNKYQTFNGIQFLSFVLSDYCMADVNVQGTRDVMLGVWLQIMAQ